MYSKLYNETDQYGTAKILKAALSGNFKNSFSIIRHGIFNAVFYFSLVLLTTNTKL